MLSLPLIAPPLDSTPFLPHPFHPRPSSPPPSQISTTTTTNPQLARQLQVRRDEERKTHNTRAPLTLLAADEAAITARKHAIRHFGAFWLRPPAVSKTLQAMHEEEAERVEQEELERREAGMRDLAARQQAAEVRAQAETAVEGGEDDGVVERDLDEEIPDADAEAEAEGDTSFNEESMVDGGSLLADPAMADSSAVAQLLDHEEGEEEALEDEALELEEAELTGAARDEEELGLSYEERDLDDSVPEAGSYQHTDTELEDSDSDSELQDSFAAPQQRESSGWRRHAERNSLSHQRSSPGPPSAQSSTGGQLSQPAPRARIQGLGGGGLQERMRAQVRNADATLPRSPGSLQLDSSVLESSFVGSSPVVQRGIGGGRGRGARRGRGS